MVSAILVALHQVRLFLETGRPATSQQKQAAVAVSDATCSILPAGAEVF